MPVEHAWGGHAHADRPAPVRGRVRQERADPPLRLAARRHGGPDAGLRPHPRGDHGDGGRLHGGALGRDLRPRAERDAGRGVRGRHDRALRGVDRPRAERHQARAGLLDGQPARLHVPGLRRGRLRGRGLPPHDPRVLQGPALPRLRLRDPRHVGRAGHAQHGRAQGQAALDAPDDARGLHGHRGRAAPGRLLLQGRDPLVRLQDRRLRPVGLGHGVRGGGHDRLLHVPPVPHDVQRDVPGHRRAGAPRARVADVDDRAPAGAGRGLDRGRLPGRPRGPRHPLGLPNWFEHFLEPVFAGRPPRAGRGLHGRGARPRRGAGAHGRQRGRRPRRASSLAWSFYKRAPGDPGAAGGLAAPASTACC